MCVSVRGGDGGGAWGSRGSWGVGGFFQAGALGWAALRDFGQDACVKGGHCFRLSLQARAADQVVTFPVFVLAEGATIAGRVTPAACLTRLPATVPAALRESERDGRNECGWERVHA